MKTEYPDDNMQFLAGGGEMGELTRGKDWSKTSLGTPCSWPQSLRTTLSIILNSKFPMFLFWGEELTCFYNDAYRPSLGKEGKHPSILGMKGEEAWPEIWSIIKPMIDQVITNGEATWSEDQLIPIDRNGKIEDVYWTFSYSPVNDESGKPAGVFVTCSETTDKVMAYNKVEERYHLMVEEVQDYAILYLNKEGIVENWNAGAERIKGYKAEEIIGKSFFNFYTEEDRKNNLPQTLLAQAEKVGKAIQEGWRVRKDSSLFWASVTITAVHNGKGEVIGFSKVTHDLTDKKAADDNIKKYAQQLEQKNADLEKMNKELQSFAYISSHDLQEPLRKIQTFSSIIMDREHASLTDNGKDMFRRMQNAALRMQTLIDDLLAYSRTNTSERKFEIADLNDIVAEVKADQREELQQKQAVIEAEELGTARIIPFQFRQLLHNLVSNSLKFSDPARPPRIAIKNEVGKGKDFDNDRLTEEKEYYHINVSDNGIGFEPEYSERIFELFQRLHGKQEYSGTGIGLSIVKKIVENHGGVITAKGALGKGAIFDIFIPAV